MRPDSFDDAYRFDWGLWVLDHGLPSLPIGLVEGQRVPVARWAGPEFAAVLLVGTCPHDPDCEPEPHFTTDTLRYRRTGDSWEAARASGGTDWDGTSLAPRPVAPDHVEFFHTYRGGGQAGGWGLPGSVRICRVCRRMDRSR